MHKNKKNNILPRVATVTLTENKEQYWHGRIDGKSYNIKIAKNSLKRPYKKGDMLLARLNVQKKYILIEPIKKIQAPLQAIYEVTHALEPITIQNIYNAYDSHVIPACDTPIEQGDIVLAQQDGPYHMHIKHVIGHKDNADTLSLIGAYEHQIPLWYEGEEEYGDTIRNLTQKIGHEPYRKDDTDKYFVTIDGEDAKDFDDAVTAEQHNDGTISVFVAIADVSHFVEAGSWLDEQARARGNSVYLPNMVIPMLPAMISNDICSLKPNEKRAACVVHFTIYPNGTTTLHDIYFAMINSRARLTYAQMQQWIDTDFATCPHKKHLNALYQGYKYLQENSNMRGKLTLNIGEKKPIFDSHNMLQSIMYKNNYNAHHLIEEYMVATNNLVACYLKQKEQYCIFRAHDAPLPTALEQLQKNVSKFGYNISSNAKRQDIQKLIDHVKYTTHERAVNLEILHVQSKALYDDKNPAHYALGLDYYCHFTSPIRRYSDLITHRALKQLLIEQRPYQQEHDDLCSHLSQTESKAVSIERKTMQRLGAQLWQQKAYADKQLGQEIVIKGVIQNFTEKGMFIELEEPLCDGFLPYSALPKALYFRDRDMGFIINKKGFYLERFMQIQVFLIHTNPLSGHVDVGYKKGATTIEATLIKKYMRLCDAVAQRRPSRKPRNGAPKSKNSHYKKKRR